MYANEIKDMPPYRPVRREGAGAGLCFPYHQCPFSHLLEKYDKQTCEPCECF
jgi:hypothetical protein